MGKSSNTSRHAAAARGGGERGLQILLHGEEGEDLAPLRHVADADAGAVLRREGGEILAGPFDAARLRALQPNDRAHQRGLADAVAAEDAGDAARLGDEINAAQAARGAVGEVEIGDLQHRSAAQIDLDHARILLHLVDRAFGEHRALVQHGDLAAEGTDELEVVLDDDDAAAAGDAAKERGGVLGLLVGHAGDQLVHQQKLRVLHQQHADL
jgi:hypothetical protein